MSHYDNEREADDVWTKFPDGATHYGGGTYWRQSGFYWMKYQKGDFHRVTGSDNPFGFRDYSVRPQNHTKPHQNAQDELKQPDPVNHPKHYAIAPGVEAIDIIKASLTPEQFEGYLLGNFLKYRLRAGDKDDLQQDIAKSNWYRERLKR